MTTVPADSVLRNAALFTDLNTSTSLMPTHFGMFDTGIGGMITGWSRTQSEEHQQPEKEKEENAKVSDRC